MLLFQTDAVHYYMLSYSEQNAVQVRLPTGLYTYI